MDKLDLTPENEETASSPNADARSSVRRRARRDFSFSSPIDPNGDTITFEAVDKRETAPCEEGTAATESENTQEEKSIEEKNELTLEGLYKNDPEEDEASSNEGLSGAGNLFDWLKSFLLSLATVIFVFTLIFRGVTVSGDSMLPTLENHEYLIISDLFYQPKTGDIVVVQSPNYKGGTEPLIKRVIATGGQTLKINFQTWQVWVDGVELQEDYIAFEEGLNMNPEDLDVNENHEAELVVEENSIFVMGDHRNDSLDSRSEAVGQIDQRYIMGRVVLRVTPFSKFGQVK